MVPNAKSLDPESSYDSGEPIDLSRDDFRPPSDTEPDIVQPNEARKSIAGKSPRQEIRQRYLKATNTSTREESLSEKVLRKGAAISLRRENRKQYKKARKADKFYCNICKVSLNSRASRKEHQEGSKHKSAAARSKEGSFYCDSCTIMVRTKVEFDRHLLSKRHK